MPKHGTILANVAVIALAWPATAESQPFEAEGAVAPSALPERSAVEGPPRPPPGSAHATFVSTDSTGWDVLVDKAPACATPCSLWVAPLRFVTLRTHERDPILLDVGILPQGDLMIRAEPLQHGAYVTGIVFTALSGMGLVTGISLTAVGCATDHSTMCKAGLITGIASGVGLYGSIWLMRKALPRAHIGSASPYVAGTSVGVAGAF